MLVSCPKFLCWLSVIPCLLCLHQENAIHLDTWTFVICSGKPSTEIVGVLLLFVGSDANVCKW